MKWSGSRAAWFLLVFIKRSGTFFPFVYARAVVSVYRYTFWKPEIDLAQQERRGSSVEVVVQSVHVRIRLAAAQQHDHGYGAEG
jgi:hypothetical protein